MNKWTFVKHVSSIIGSQATRKHVKNKLQGPIADILSENNYAGLGHNKTFLGMLRR